MNTKNRRKEIDINSMVFGKVPPQANELESAVLGAIMLERDAFDTVVEILKPECFYKDANQKIFAAMVSLSQKQMPIDLLTVVEELKTKEELEMVGGPYYVSRLTNDVVSSANIVAHSKIIKAKYVQRELIRMSGEIASQAFEDSADVTVLLDTVDKNLTELISGTQEAGFSSIGSVATNVAMQVEIRRHNKSEVTGVHTGWDSLNKVTRGWQPTDLIILAARPSVGKTAFAINLAMNGAADFLREYQVERTGIPKSVGFFSLEMSKEQITERGLSAQTEIWLEKIKTGRIDECESKTLYHKGVQKFDSLPIFIDDTGALNIFQLRAKCRRLKNKHNLGLIIIDYLQLMSGTSENKNSNREQEISRISRDLKALAKELKVPVIALSQLSREVEKRKEGAKIPQLSDLRESGAIEQDADLVMFLYRPEYYDITANEMGESTKGDTFLKIAKHRNGSLETVKFKAQLHIQKFIEDDGKDDFSSNQFPLGHNFRPVGKGQEEEPF